MTVFETMFLTWGFLGLLFYIYVYAEDNTNNNPLVCLLFLIILGPYMLSAYVFYWIVMYIIAFVTYYKFLNADEEELKVLKARRAELWTRKDPIGQMLMMAYNRAFTWWHRKTNQE